MLRSFNGTTGTNEATAMLPPWGVFVCRSLNFFADAIGTIKFYLFSIKTKANTAVSADTDVTIPVDGDGNIKGYTLTTSDYVAVNEAAGLAIRAVSSIAAASGGARVVTLGANVTCDAGATVFVCKAANIMSRATAADENATNNRDEFTSKRNCPVYVEVSATGTNTLSGNLEQLEEVA